MTTTLDQAKRIFQAYKDGGNHPRSSFTSQAKTLIQTRLKQGYEEDALMAACHGWRYDPWGGRENARSLIDIMRPRNIERFSEWHFQGGSAPENETDRRVLDLLHKAAGAGLKVVHVPRIEA